MQAGQTIRSVIIDDESGAIMLLEEIISKTEGIAVCGHAQDVDSGLKLILQHHPDMVFLDIRLHEKTGFDLIRELRTYDHDPFIVMVTGFDNFGLEALKSGAFDYLLKPVDPGELLKVIGRYRQKMMRLQQPEPVQKIRFNTLGGFILINPDDILYCKAEANYTDIYLTGNQKYTISLNIGTIEKTLEKPRFFRISRSIIINLKYLTEINRGKRLVTLSFQNFSCQVTIAHDRIKDLEAALVQ